MKTIDDVLNKFPEWPEGAVCVAESRISSTLKPSVVFDVNPNWSVVCTREEYEQAKAERDKTWMPEVGQECEWLSYRTEVWTITKLIAYDGNGQAWLEGEGVVSVDEGVVKRFRPIKTEREKFIETATSIYGMGEHDKQFVDHFSKVLFDSGKFKLVDE